MLVLHGPSAYLYIAKVGGASSSEFPFHSGPETLSPYRQGSQSSAPYSEIIERDPRLMMPVSGACRDLLVLIQSQHVPATHVSFDSMAAVGRKLPRLDGAVIQINFPAQALELSEQPRIETRITNDALERCRDVLRARS